MKKTVIGLGTALLLSAGMASAQSISVINDGDVISDNFSFRIDYSSPNTTDTYVSKTLGTGIKNCSIAFQVNASNMNLTNAANDRFATAVRVLRENGPSRHRMIFYVVKNNANTNFSYAVAVRDDGGTFRFRNNFLGTADIDIEIQITSSSPAGANNGKFEVFRNGVSHSLRENLDLDEFDCNELIAGEIFGQTRQDAGGYVILDNFVAAEL